MEGMLTEVTELQKVRNALRCPKLAQLFPLNDERAPLGIFFFLTVLFPPRPPCPALFLASLSTLPSAALLPSSLPATRAPGGRRGARPHVLEQRATPPRHMWGLQPPPWPRGRGPLHCRRTWPRIPPRRQLLPWPAEATTTSFHDSPKFELLVHMRLKLIRSLASSWPITPFSSSNLS